MKLVYIGENTSIGLRGYQASIFINFEKTPHLLITGVTGSGKTVLSKSILSQLEKKYPKGRLYLCDYKGDQDFNFAYHQKQFFRYKDVYLGLEEFYAEFKLRQSGLLHSDEPLFLFFDEYTNWLTSLQNSDVKDVKNWMSEILAMGRSFRCHVILSVQRPDAKHFDGQRDNLGIRISLGHISDEAARMMFPGESLRSVEKRHGYVYQDGSRLMYFRVPNLRGDLGGYGDSINRFLVRSVREDDYYSPVTRFNDPNLKKGVIL